MTDVVERVNDIYSAVVQSEECLERIACEIGGLAADVGITQSPITQWVALKSTIVWWVVGSGLRGLHLAAGGRAIFLPALMTWQLLGHDVLGMTREKRPFIPCSWPGLFLLHMINVHLTSWILAKVVAVIFNNNYSSSILLLGLVRWKPICYWSEKSNCDPYGFTYCHAAESILKEKVDTKDSPPRQKNVRIWQEAKQMFFLPPRCWYTVWLPIQTSPNLAVMNDMNRIFLKS